MEEAQISVHQSDPLLIAGINDNLVSSRARRSSDVLHAALHRDTGENVIENFFLFLNKSHFRMC